MSWVLLVFIHTAITVTKDTLRKYSLKSNANMAVIAVEFVIAFLTLGLGAWLFEVNVSLDIYAATFFAIGLLHGLGSMSKVHGVNLSLSQTQLISMYNSVLPALLAFFFLGEAVLFTPNSIPGMIRILVIILFPISLWLMGKSRQVSKEGMQLLWLINMIVFVVTHGLVSFLVKVFIVDGFIVKAAVFRRFGAAVMTLVGAFYDKEVGLKQTKKFWTIGLVNGVLIAVGSVVIQYALADAPLSIMLPMRKMMNTTLVVLVGLFVFHERKKLDKYARIGYALSAVGAVLLVLAEVFQIAF